MNPITIVKFFHIICDVVFNLLLATSQAKVRLLGLISTYFAIIEITGREILYLHYPI